MPHKIKPIRIYGDIAYVPLTQGYEAIIDAADAKLVGQFNWYAFVPKRKDGSIAGIYAGRNATLENGKQRQVLMHRVILSPDKSIIIDHKDGNGLNNRRCNLREATVSQNAQNRKKQRNNSSGITGVCWDKSAMKWKSYVRINGKTKHLGLFSRKSDAASAAMSARQKIHGDFFRTS